MNKNTGSARPARAFSKFCTFQSLLFSSVFLVFVVLFWSYVKDWYTSKLRSCSIGINRL